VGTLGYGPNVDAVEWFVREVLPRVWAVRPEVRVQVAGFGSGAHLAELLRDTRCAVADSTLDGRPPVWWWTATAPSSAGTVRK
jgi:hypothetical protein